MGVAEREDELDTEQQDQGDEGADDEGQEGSGEGGEEAEEGEGAEGTEGAEGADGESEVVVSIGGEEAPASEDEKSAPKWVKDLRQRQRELARENAELKAKLGTGQPGAMTKPVLPPKPTLADNDYDEEKFQAAMDGWYAKKREVEAFDAHQQAAAEEHQRAVRAVHENYAKSKQDLGVKNFAELEETVQAQLSEVQQSILIQGAANPAAVVAALGANPKKLAELASIKDPVKFTWAAAQLETKVNVTKRTTTKPAPEKGISRGGTTTAAGSSSATLDRLRAEAEKTGDRSKVAAYLRKQRQAGTK